MAKIGTAPAANRYDGIPVGPRFAYLFETQEGLPIDGTNSLLRDLSPFTLRLIPPDALLEASATSESGVANEAATVDLIQAAALGSSTGGVADQVATALSTVLVTGSTAESTLGELERFVATGQFFTQSSAAFVSTLADAFTAADIALQIQRILNAEPLTLLVNPSDMSVSYTKIQSYQSRTRFGYVFEAWGEDQPTISFSGMTAGFVAGAVDVANPSGAQVSGEASSVTGYQEAARRDSAAWQNFMALYHFYRNNGYIFDTIGGSEAHLFIGSVAIDFDQWTYVGHIESFSYRFEEGSPHKVSFDLEFKVSRMYDRAVSSAVVLPQTAPTVSPTRTGFVTGGSSSGASFSGRSATSAASTPSSEVAQTPVDILGSTP
jgi:hypothetical protein